MGEINNVFYLTQCIQNVISTGKQYLNIEVFTLFFMLGLFEI